ATARLGRWRHRSNADRSCRAAGFRHIIARWLRCSSAAGELTAGRPPDVRSLPFALLHPRRVYRAMLEKSRADAAAAGRLAPRAAQADPDPLYCFCVLAAADPGVMPRVLQQ